MTQTEQVAIAVRWGTHLLTREAATVIMQEYPAASLLILDFEDVAFVSRSFADQLVKEVTVRRATGRVVECRHLAAHVQDMFAAVWRTQRPAARRFTDVSVVELPTTLAMWRHFASL